MKNRRGWAPLFVGGAVLAAVLFALVPTASSTPGDVYSTKIVPASRVAGTSGPGSTYDLTITNDPSSPDTIGAIQVTLPSGYGDVVAASASGWTDSESGRVATLTNATGLAVGDSVDISIQADTPKEAIPYVWQTKADSDPGFNFDAGTPDFTSEGDPEVQVTPGPVSTFGIGLASSTQTAGTPFDATVVALDAYGNQVHSYDGTIHFTSTDGGSQLPGDYTFTDSDSGSHVFTNGVTLTTAGSQTITATDTADSSISGTSGPIAVNPGPIDHFGVAAPSSAVAGDPLSVTVTAFDGFGNVKSDYAGTVRFSTTDPGTQNSLPGDYAFQAGDDGSHLFTDGATLTTVGSQTITAADTSDSSKSGTSDPISVSPGPIDHFKVAAPSTTVAGDPLSVTVTAFDGFGNVKTDYAGTVQFSTTDTGSQTALPGDYTFQAGDNGAHSFTNGVTLTKAGSQTVSVADGSDSSKTGTSDAIGVTHASLDHFTLDPVADAMAGVGFTVKATAEDAFENPLGGDYHGTPMLSGSLLGSPRGCPGAGSSCSATYGNPAAVSDGVATWSGVTGYGAQTGATVTATDGQTTGTSNAFAIKHALLDHFTMGAVSSPQVAGDGFQVSATAEDAFENPLGNDYSGGATLSGTLTNSSRGCGTGNKSQCSASYGNPASWSSGIGTWTVTAYNAESGRTVTAKDGSIIGTSNTFVVQPADPALLTFTQQPNDAQPNPPSCSGSAVCTIQTKVQDLDFYGNPEIGVPVNVRIDPFNNPGIDTLTALTTGECTSGVCTQNADSSGVATFSDLTLHNFAINYKLQATSGPTVGASPPASQTSGFFNVAQTVTKCNGNCSANATDPLDTITATATGVGGNLSITLENNKTVTNGAQCVITNEVGNLVTVNPTAPAPGATLEVTGTLLHKSNKGGVGNIVFCKNSGGNSPFHAVPLCTQTKPKNSAPCLKKLSGNGQGDVFFDLIVVATPDPNNPGGFIFDPSMGGGT